MTSDTKIDGLFGDPAVIKDDGEYVMYYGAIKGDFSDPQTVRIFRATSPDGIIWTRNSVPVLTPGAPGSWDAVKVEVPYVLKLSAGEYRMYYAGNDDTTEVGWQIGLATSADGVNWTKHPANPILGPGSSGDFDEISALEPSVLYDANRQKYTMWYTGITGFFQTEIGAAESQDGIVWNKLGRVMRLDVERENPGDRGVTEPDVLWHNGRFEMFYVTLLGEGVGGAIWHAVSDDGLRWQKETAPILVRGDSASWTGQAISAPSVLVDGGKYRMWYAGNHTDFTSFFESGIGLAEKSIPTGVKDEGLAVPVAFELSQNYPNPFNPTSTIRFSLPKAEHVTLKVFDVNGREMATLVDEERPAGEHAVVFDTKGLASGVYFYRLTAGPFTQIRKALLMK